MVSIQRRKLLAGAGLGLGISLAGCSALDRSGDSPNRARISYVHVDIVHEQSHTVDLLIMDDEEPIYLQSKTFEGAADESDPFEIGGGHFEDLPEAAGEYVIWLQLDDQRWDTFDMSRWDSLPAGWEEGDFPEALVVSYTIGHEGREEGPPAVKLTVGVDNSGDSEE